MKDENSQQILAVLTSFRCREAGGKLCLRSSSRSFRNRSNMAVNGDG